MAYAQTYTPITVADSAAFNDGADFGDIRNAGSLGSEQIDMSPGGRSLSSLLADFDQPPPPPVSPGSFVRNIEIEANNWGAAFGDRVEQAQQAARNYWAAPVAVSAARQPAGGIDSAMDRVGSFADGLANAFTGTKPVQPEQGVETAALDRSQRGLTGNFGQLSQNEGSAFERRYQQPTTPKRNGNDYV